MATNMSAQFSDPKSVAEAGEKIYREHYQTRYETTHQGKFLAVDILSGNAYLGHDPEAALTEAKKNSPQGRFHLIKIGSLGAYRVSYTSNAGANWLYK